MNKKRPASAKPQPSVDRVAVRRESLDALSKRLMLRYAFHVIEDRSLPDIYDGLKPVQRRVLYSMNQLARTRQVKTARIVGDVLGRYHPHGDKSVADAVATIVHQNLSPVVGVGNWGNLIDNAAAMRYTEVRISKYGASMFEPDYFNEGVVTFVPNYDGRDKEPFVLPALLPNVIINGVSTGIAVGVATVIPSFTAASVCNILERLLKGERLKALDFAATLKPAFVWGGHIVNTRENKLQWLALMQGSRARIAYYGEVKRDASHKQVVLSEWPAGLKPETVHKQIRNLPETGLIRTTRGSMEFTISMKSGYNQAQYEAWAAKIEKMMRCTISYNMNLTERSIQNEDGVVSTKIKLMSLSVPQIIMRWLQLRLELELRSLENRVRLMREAIAYTKLIIYATSILDVIRKAWEAPEFVPYVMKHGKLTEAQAKTLAQFRLIQLSKLDQREWQDKLRKQEAHVRQLQAWQAKPKPKLLADLQNLRTALALDEHVSGRTGSKVVK